MQALEADNEKWQGINEDLILELERRDEELKKRDLAVEEAVDLICVLEAKIEDLEAAETRSRQFSGSTIAQAPSIAAPPPSTEESRENPTTPPPNGQLDQGNLLNLQNQARADASYSRVNTLSPSAARSPRRAPSFLRDATKSTHALRSLYSTNGNTSSVSLTRPNSMFSGNDDDEFIDQHMLNSPRLSILSESGFSSIYGHLDDKGLSPGCENESSLPNGSPPEMASPSSCSQRDNQREARLQKWIEERNMPSTPTRTSPKAGASDHFTSIGEILEKLPTERSPKKTSREPREESSPEKRRRKEARNLPNRPQSPSFGGPMFGRGILPPTPDTMSTMTVGENSSTASIVTEKSLLDGAPYSAKGYSAVLAEECPHTSDSNFPHMQKTALAYGGDEQDPAWIKQTEMRVRKNTRHSHRPSISSNESTKVAESVSSHAPTRPSLMSYSTDIASNRNGYSPTQASRTLSYPSPTTKPLRPSNQLSPTSHKSSGSNAENFSTLSPQDWISASSTTATPTRPSPRDVHHRSPSTLRSSDTSTSHDADPNVEPSSKLRLRPSSLRSKMAKVTLNPTPSNQSFSSRLFRRSNSQQLQTPSNVPEPPHSRPLVVRAISSSQYARQPRPSSLYGQSPSPSPTPSPTSQLASILPSGMLTDLSRYRSSRHGHRTNRH